MDKFMSICSEDPELTTLLKDHPILLKSLESIPSLQAEHIFSILTAVENETYVLTKDFQSSQADRRSLFFDSTLEIEELKLMLVKEQEHNQTLNQVTPTQQIIKLSESLSDISKTIQDRSRSSTSKHLNFSLLERENKELKNQIADLTEQLSRPFESQPVRSENPKKERAFPLSSVIGKIHFKRVLSIFSVLKFHFYQKAKFQEEIESKVTHKQMQENFTHKTESLNDVRACSKKYFSQLVNLISFVNDQKPLEIELSNCELSKEWLELLLQALENNSSVTELNLGSNSLSDECGILISTWVKQDSYLKCLILRNNDFNEMVTSGIIEAVCIQNQILMLDISENIVSVDSINYLIQHSNAISDLVIENCGLSGEDITKVLAIAKGSYLSGLFVSYNPVTNQGIKGIIEGFCSSSLKNIGLSGLPFDDSDVKEICTLINKKPYLEILHLAHVELSEQSMSRILDSLCKHDDLKEIDLTGTSLHIPHVCVVIETCTFLKTIVLREIVVSPRDYSFLAETIKKSPQLEVCLLDN